MAFGCSGLSQSSACMLAVYHLRPLITDHCAVPATFVAGKLPGGTISRHDSISQGSNGEWIVTLFALLFSIVFGVGSLAYGYRLAGFVLFVRWIVYFGLGWLLAAWRRWRWFAYVGLGFNLLAAALGLWLLNFPPGWMFAGAVGGLLAFDLTDFRYSLIFSASDKERHIVENRHLPRVTFLAALAMLFASLAMWIKKQLTVEWALLLLGIAIFGAIQVVVRFRRRDI